MNTAPEFLHRAATIMEERGKQYDKPGGERSMGKTVAAFNAITGQDMTEEQGWAFMLVLKQVRFFSNTTAPHRDSLEDAIAYSALLAESAMQVPEPSGSNVKYKSVGHFRFAEWEYEPTSSDDPSAVKLYRVEELPK